jgi:hypothetical protein
MCKFKSGIVLKDRIYCPLNHDHHTQMLEELGIRDDSQFPNFVRVEMIPRDGDVFNHDLNNWKLNVDQDFRPDWFDADKTEKEMKVKMQEAFEKMFIIDREVEEISSGEWYLKNGIIRRLGGNAIINVMRGSSQVNEMWGSSQVKEMWESSQVKEMWESSQVKEMLGNSQVNVMRGSSQVFIPSSKNVKIVSINDNATVKDLSDKPKLIVANDFEIVTYEGGV